GPGVEGRLARIVEGRGVAGEQAVRLCRQSLQRDLDAECPSNAGRIARGRRDDVGLQGGRLSAVAAARAGAVAALADRLPGRRDRIPTATEAGQPFASGLPGLRVLDEVVERVTGVGDLETTVGAPARSEQIAVRTGDRPRPALGDQRRPVHRAVAVAGALRALVVRPDVQRLALRIDENATEVARPDLDDRVATTRE